MNRFEIGNEIEGYCGKCKTDTFHIITAVDDNVGVSEDVSVNVDVLSNDVDLDGDVVLFINRAIDQKS